jgi:hypothetical protein
MLLASILQILNEYKAQPAVKPAAAVEKTDPKTFTFSETEKTSKELEKPGLQQLESEIAAAAGLLRPLSIDPDLAPIKLPGPNLEELMQIIEKLKEPYKTRVVDRFE